MADATSPQIDYDVIVIGAGLSGINAAYRVQSELPGAKYVVLESRSTLGGTWDLFKYPGIRSDSDLYSFGFPWYPWPSSQVIAEAPAIVQYMHDAAGKFGIDQRIRYNAKVLSSNWSSETQSWTVNVDGEDTPYTAKFVICCTGYYDYNEPLQANIPGLASFGGRIVHPQFWPENLDYENKKMIIIGSGATAITLLPNLAKKAAHVTMVQRSPSYVFSLPANDSFGIMMRRIMPASLANTLVRWKYLLQAFLFVRFCTYFPSAARGLVRFAAKKQLPADFPLDPHFQPSYNPWEQRMCMCPEGDFFKAFHGGRASIVTGTIAEVQPTGVQMADGTFVDADIIVTATGLKMLVGGGMRISVDGAPLTFADKFLWKGMMLQDLPNVSVIIGYTNAAWTLGSDATSRFTARLLKHMRSHGLGVAVPRLADASNMTTLPVLDLKSTYVMKAKDLLPRAATVAPWLPRFNYFYDSWTADHGGFEALEFVPSVDKTK